MNIIRRCSRIKTKLLPLYVLAQLPKRLLVMSVAKKNPKIWVKVQNKEIKHFVKYLYSIPFYRKMFQNRGIEPNDINKAQDFLKLPFLTKEELKKWINDEISEGEESYYKYYLKGHTTGSTGVPLNTYSLPRDRADEIINLYRCAKIQHSGYSIFQDSVFILMCGDEGLKSKHPYSYQVSSTESSEYVYRKLIEKKPDFMYGNKSALLNLAIYIENNQLTVPPLKCLASISEKLDNNSRTIINRVFRTNVIDIYGCVEVGNFAVECGKEGRHVIWNDTHVVNLIDKQKIGKNHYRGKLCITSLIHYGFPIVNYCLGDEVEIIEEDGVTYITDIIGRTNDVIKNSDGSTYSWLSVYRIMQGMTDIVQFKVIQKDYYNLQFMLVPSTGINKVIIEREIKRRAKRYFNREEKVISFQWRDSIPIEKNGKVKVLISEIE